MRQARRKVLRSALACGSDIWAKPPALAWRRGYSFGLPASGAGASRLTWPLQRPRPRRAPLPVLSEGIDAISDLLGRGEAGALEGGAAEDREPDLDLVHPGGVGRREVEAHVGMTSLMFAQVRGWGVRSSPKGYR